MPAMQPQRGAGRTATHRPGSVQDSSGHTIFSTGDLGHAHAMAHRMLDEGSIERGFALLSTFLEGRSGSGSEWIHLQFHMAVFELELGLWDAAYARFCDHLLPAAAETTDALTDAPALGWRLWLAADSPNGFPWEPVRHAAAARLDSRDDPWVDLHNALALAGAGDLDTLSRWFQSRRARPRTTRDHLMLQVAEGLRAHASGEMPRAEMILADALPRIPEIGGSRAQNQLFAQIVEACRRRVDAAGRGFAAALAA